jgi:hypothetical protein
MVVDEQSSLKVAATDPTSMASLPIQTAQQSEETKVGGEELSFGQLQGAPASTAAGLDTPM